MYKERKISLICARYIALIFLAAIFVMLLTIVSRADTYNVSGKKIEINTTASGTTVRLGAEAPVNDDGEIKLQGTTTSQSIDWIKITADEGTTAKVTLDGLDLQKADVELHGAGDIEIELDNENKLASICKDDTMHTGKLTIKDANTTSGSLAVDRSFDTQNDNAGIGSREGNSASNITIAGGKILATSSNAGACIGSGKRGKADNITITGGTITANYTGVYDANGNMEGKGAACIGSGAFGDVGNITITGGTIEINYACKYGDHGACIGAGDSGDVDAIVISGGNITATSDSWLGTVIGSGSEGDVKNLTISGGTIQAELTNMYASGTMGTSGAVIGSGYCGDVEKIAITGGNVTAIGFDDGAGIGTGWYGIFDDIVIEGDNTVVNVYNRDGRGGFESAAGIGSGSCNMQQEVGTITINGGKITAKVGGYGAAIGSGGNTYIKNIFINGGNVTATSNGRGAAIGSAGGQQNFLSGEDVGNIIIKGENTVVNATSTSMGAAIGSGGNGKIDCLQIISGTVTATKTSGYGAAIGSGDGGHVENIKIEGGTITADVSKTRSSYAAAIGAGNFYSSREGSGTYSEILITGGDITAKTTSGVAIGSNLTSGATGKLVISGGKVTVEETSTSTPVSIGANTFAISEMTEVKDDAKVIIMTCKDPEEKKEGEKYNINDYITTCELGTAGYLIYSYKDGSACWKEIYGTSDNKHVWADATTNGKYPVQISEATCTEGGTYYKSCTRCEMRKIDETFTTAALGHLYTDEEGNKPWVATDADCHYHKCLRENCSDLEGSRDGDEEHKFKYDSGEDSDLCIVCGYNRAHTHNPDDGWTEFIPEVPATCQKEGTKEHYKCSECSKLFENMAGMLVPIDEEEKIPKKDHEAKEYKKDSSGHWMICENIINGKACGEKFNVGEHSYGSDNKCIYCGYKKSGLDTDGSGGGSSSSHINTGWIKDSKGWRYRNSDGTLAQGTTVTDKDGNKVEKILWQKAGNGYFAFGSDTYLVTGWIYDRLEDKWYYCDENAGKLYGWFYSTVDGYWYYLSPSTGEALTGWHSINGKDYYFATAPSAPTYSFDASTDTWIYSNINGVRPFGSMYANTVTPDNYRVDANGAWIH